MCLTPKFSSNAAPITTPPLLIIAFARWVKIPPEVLSWRIFSSLLYAATAENSAVPFFKLLYRAGFNARTAAYARRFVNICIHKSLAVGFHTYSFDRAFVGTRRTAAAIVLVIQLYMFFMGRQNSVKRSGNVFGRMSL